MKMPFLLISPKIVPKIQLIKKGGCFEYHAVIADKIEYRYIHRASICPASGMDRRSFFMPKTMGKYKRLEVFYLSKEEVERIHEKMDELGIRSMGAYLRKMALDGYCIRLDLQDVKALVSLLRICSNNLNQYAKRANETGSIYEADINDLQVRLEEIWADMKEVLVRLSSIQ